MGRCRLIVLALLLCGFQFKTDGLFQTDGLLLIGRPPASGTCTDGVDCFCDTTSGDTLELGCADFEHAQLYEGGTNNFVAGGSSRGSQSRWFLDYGNGSCSALWLDNEPNATPRVGSMCDASSCTPGVNCVCNTANPCVGTLEYCSAAQGAIVDGGGANCWEANTDSVLDIQRTDDYKAEIGTFTLSGGSGVTADIGAGDQHAYFRTPLSGTAGFTGGINFGGNYTEVGITMLLAFSSNWATADIGYGAGRHYKGDEWSDGGGAFAEYWVFGNLAIGPDDNFPFSNFFWSTNGTDCNTALSGATVSVGSAGCNGSNLYFYPTNGTGTNQYSRSADWPYGQWKCIQAHITGMGTSSMTVKKWFEEELIFEMTGFNGTIGIDNQQYDQIGLNHFTNNNQGGGGYDGTDEVGGRYQDNMYIRNGPPVSCDVIRETVPFATP